MDSPIRRQYLDLKRRHANDILLFRLGDFYETFDDDARVVARELDIVLTSREMGQGTRVPLAGIPAHSLEGHLARLVKRGHRVAVCEQLADTTSVKGLLPREVVRVVTPGTVTESALLTPSENNYLAAVVVEGDRVGLAYADISTGEFATTEVRGPDAESRLGDELARLRPAEIVMAQRPAEAVAMDRPMGRSDTDGCVRLPAGTAVAQAPAWRFDLDEARRALLEQFDVSALDGYGCAHLPFATRAAGALVLYLRDHQKQALLGLEALATYSLDASMQLDDATIASLELWDARGNDPKAHGTLLGVLDDSRTAMGARLLRRWLTRPLLELEPLWERQRLVTELVHDGATRARLRELIGRLPDLERLTARVAQRTASPRDLYGLRASLRAIPAIRISIENSESGALRAIASELPDGSEPLDLLTASMVDEPPPVIGDTRTIRPGYRPDLDDIEQSAAEARDWLARLEAVERERTGIKGLKVGYHRVFGYYVEISAAYRGEVPDDYVRKQTLASGERYVTHDLKQREGIVLSAQERFLHLEREVFADLLVQIARWGHDFARAAATLARLDAFAALAEVAVKNRYVAPELVEDGRLRIVGGRHPVVERTVSQGAFVPNDVDLSTTGPQIAVVTGPNMAGKSTYLRQTALITLMAQIGSWVPAEAAVISLVDRVFTRVGARDDVAQGRSTFMVEMLELANILTQATARSLIVLDEVGRGTSTYDGLAIARATIEYLHNAPRLGAKTLFASHYHELIELASVLPRVVNYNVSVIEEGDRVIFLHKIVPGGADRSYGIHVARIAGVPKAVTRRAEEILHELERGKRQVRPPARQTREVQVSLLDGLMPSGEAQVLLRELSELDVLSTSPLDALTRLFELQQKAKALE